MNIEVWFFGHFRELATRKQLVNLGAGARFGDLCDRLVQMHGTTFDQLSRKHDDYFIMINGRYCSRSADLGQRPLHDGDLIAFLPMVAGG